MFHFIACLIGMTEEEVDERDSHKRIFILAFLSVIIIIFPFDVPSKDTTVILPLLILLALYNIAGWIYSMIISRYYH